MKGTWPRSKNDYDLLVESIRNHFANHLRRLRLIIVKGDHAYVFAVERTGKYVGLKVNFDSPDIDIAFTEKFLDAIVEHESRHLDLISDWGLVTLSAPLIVGVTEGKEKYNLLTQLQTLRSQEEITEVFAISRMTDGLGKYVEWLNYTLEASWRRANEFIYTRRSPKSLWLLPLARQELVALRAGVSLSDEFGRIKGSVVQNPQDEVIYSQAVAIYDTVWQQARREPPVLNVVDSCKRLSDALFNQTSPYVSGR